MDALDRVADGLILLSVVLFVFLGKQIDLYLTNISPSQARYDQLIQEHNRDLGSRIVTTGDAAVVQFHSGLRSIRGYYAIESAIFRPVDSQLAPWSWLGAKRGKTWGEKIRMARSEEFSIVTGFAIPSNPDLLRTTVEGIAEVKVVFPASTSPSTFKERNETIARRISVHIFDAAEKEELLALRSQRLTCMDLCILLFLTGITWILGSGVVQGDEERIRRAAKIVGVFSAVWFALRCGLYGGDLLDIELLALMGFLLGAFVGCTIGFLVGYAPVILIGGALVGVRSWFLGRGLIRVRGWSERLRIGDRS